MQLFENAAATAAALVAIILAVGPVSGAHLDPVVTLADRAVGGLSTADAATYLVAQVTGAVLGTMVANVMFGEAVVAWSTTGRTGGGLWLAEAVATFGLLLVVFGVVRSGRPSVAPFAVGAWIGGAYFFTASTSFANRAVTLARTLTDTFAGIRPSSAPAFVAFQLVGATVAVATVRVLYPDVHRLAVAVVVAHEESGGHLVAPYRERSGVSSTARARAPWRPRCGDDDGGSGQRHMSQFEAHRSIAEAEQGVRDGAYRSAL